MTLLAFLQVNALSVSYNLTSFSCGVHTITGTFDCSFNGLVIVTPGAGELDNPPPSGLGYTVTNGVFTFDLDINGSGPLSFNMDINVTSSNNPCVTASNNMISTPMTHDCILPPNNACSSSSTLVVAANSCTTMSFTTDNATETGAVPSCASAGFEDVWYDFVATGSMANIEVTDIPGSFVRYALWTGCGGTELQCGLIFGTTTDAQLSGLSSGTIYKLEIMILSSASGDLDICLYNPTTVPLQIASFEANTIDETTAEINLETYEISMVEHIVLQRANENDQVFEDIHNVNLTYENTDEYRLNYIDEDLDPGNKYLYRIMTIDFDGYTEYSDIVSVQTDSRRLKNDIEVYPNPTSDILFVKNMGDFEQEVMLTDIAGSKIISASVASNDISRIDMEELDSGIYLLHIINGDERTSQKIVKY